METFQSLLATKLSDALAKSGFPDAGELTQAADLRFGDYQTNAAMVLAKRRGENPRKIAEKILEHLARMSKVDWERAILPFIYGCISILITCVTSISIEVLPVP